MLYCFTYAKWNDFSRPIWAQLHKWTKAPRALCISRSLNADVTLSPLWITVSFASFCSPTCPGGPGGPVVPRSPCGHTHTHTPDEINGHIWSISTNFDSGNAVNTFIPLGPWKFNPMFPWWSKQEKLNVDLTHWLTRYNNSRIARSTTTITQ